MRINNNLMAMNTHRQLGINSDNGAKSIEKLSSGLRINRAGDDAAGLAISEKMRSQVRGLNQASRNAQDGISLIQTAEGALNESQAILQRMRELAVQSSTVTNTDDDRAALDKEFQELDKEVERIASKTEFNTQTLLKGGLGATSTAGTGLTPANGMSSYNVGGATVGSIVLTSAAGADAAHVDLTAAFTDASGNVTTQFLNEVTLPTGANTSTVSFDQLGFSFTANASLAAASFAGDATSTITITGSSAKFQIGANANQTIDLTIGNMDSATLGIDTLDVKTADKAQLAITALDGALKKVSDERSNLGAVQNRLEHTIKNLDTSSENLQASESRIRDVDMAKEMMNFTKNNILQQAAQAMLAQANQAPQGVLQLLR